MNTIEKFREYGMDSLSKVELRNLFVNREQFFSNGQLTQKEFDLISRAAPAILATEVVAPLAPAQPLSVFVVLGLAVLASLFGK